MTVERTAHTWREAQPHELSLPDLRREVHQIEKNIKDGLEKFSQEERSKMRKFLEESRKLLVRETNQATTESIEGIQELGTVIGEINRILPGLVDDIP